MDHAEVVELIELAAVEPEGLVRLTAGDTAEAASVAGHIAGCEACALELARTARAASLAREAIRELPDPALRERTLAFVRELGRDPSAVGAAFPGLIRDAAAHRETAGAARREGVGVAKDAAIPAAFAPTQVGRGRRPWWAAAAVAAVLVAGIAGFLAGGAGQAPVSSDGGAVAMAAAQTTMRIAAQPDAVRIALAPAPGSAGWGTLLYSATSGELSMAAVGLAPAPDGATYACWVEVGGQRRKIGALYMEGADGTWAGKVSGLAGLPAGTSFGVSLVPAGTTTGTPVLLGSG